MVIYPKNRPTKHVIIGWSHQTNKHFVLKLILFNSEQLQNNWQLQNNSVNGAVLITMSRVITVVIMQVIELCRWQFQVTALFPFFNWHPLFHKIGKHLQELYQVYLSPLL